MNVLSIQSWVAYGHVGNAAAIFPLQRLGHEVWPINTVQFSNHTGYKQWRGAVFPAEHVAELVEGINDRGVLGQCNAVLSGYLGDAATGRAILDAVARVKALNPSALYCCDPVIGDEGRGVFVQDGIPEFFAEHSFGAADILTPNQFELEYLTKREVETLDDVAAAARSLIEKGPSMIAVTSVRAPAVEDGMLGTVLATKDDVWLATTPLLHMDPAPSGTGDVFASLLLGHLLKGAKPQDALQGAVSSLYAVLLRTMEENSREILLITCQDFLAYPPVQTVNLRKII